MPRLWSLMYVSTSSLVYENWICSRSIMLKTTM